MAKGKAYDIGDILGVKDPTEETAKPAKPKKTPKAKATKKDKPTSRPAEAKGKQYKEKRDKRLQVVIPARLYDTLKAEAGDAGVSVNEVVNVLLESGLKKRG